MFFSTTMKQNKYLILKSVYLVNDHVNYIIKIGVMRLLQKY